MTGSFLFVKPTDPEGKPGTAYSGNAPCYAYDIASWEWLQERVLRRQLLPLALSVSDPEHYREVLACHEDQYRTHRWTYPPHELNSLDADVVDTESGLYPFSAFLAPRMKTDSDVLRYDVRPLLPVSWERTGSGPNCGRVSTGFGPRTLAMHAQSLVTTSVYFRDSYRQIYDYAAESPEFLPPDWSPSDMDAWDQTAESTETTVGTGRVENGIMSWRWRSTVQRTEFENPGSPVFKCLTHMRLDDPATTVALTDDSGATVPLEVPPTPWAFRRDTSEYGSVREERGTQVRVDSRATAHSVASVRYALTIPYVTEDVDYSPATSGAPFDRSGKTNGDMYVGYLAKPPGLADKMPVVGNGGTAVPDVDWDGKPTWWHANGFPKGLESTLSDGLREQLSVLLSVYQPAVPPFYVPLADAAAFPKPGKTHAWPYTDGGIMPYYFPSRHLAQAVTPFDISARMDVMTTTVHPVPHLYAKFTTKATRTETNVHKYTKTGVKPATRTSTTTYTYTHTGATLNPITGTTGLDTLSVTGYSMSEAVRVLSETKTKTSGSTLGNSLEGTQDTDNYSLGVTATCSSLTCLRTSPPTSGSEQFVGHKTETRYRSQTTSSDADPTSTDRTDVSGSEPSYDLNPKWLMFPEWILPWMESADLYAAVESRILYVKAPAYTRERQTTVDNYDNGTYTHTGSGSGKGEITHKSRMKMVNLGTMDLSTGKFPELDVARLLSEDIDPDPEALTVFFPKSELTNTNTNQNASRRVETTDSVVSIPKPTGNRTRTASYFVVVRWKFDQPSPPTMGDSSFKDLFKEFNAADTALEAKKLEIARLKSGLELAKSRLAYAEDDLERAQERRDYPESAEYSQTQEAERALEDAKAKLLNAQAALANAQAEMDAAQEALQEVTEAYATTAQASEQEVADAQAEYSRSVDAARTEYDAAKAAYDAATGTAKDALDAAREDYDTATGAAWDAVEAAERALDSAGDAAREAANAALSDYDSAVADAQADLEAAQADPEATQADLDAAQAAYDDAVEAAQADLDAATADAEAEYESAMADAMKAYDDAVEAYETARDSAQADLDAAQAAYDDAVEAAQGDLDTAQAAYDAAAQAAQTTLDEATTAADGRLSAAGETLADATTAHGNARAAWKKASYAEADARALVDEAQARLDALKAELKEDDPQAAVEKAQAAVDAEQELVDELQEAVDSAEAELPDLEARLEAAKDALRQAGATGVA